MCSTGNWTLAPAFDVTYCDGPGGNHQMDVMGEALNPGYDHICSLGMREAELNEKEVRRIIEKITSVASTSQCWLTNCYRGKTPEILCAIFSRILTATSDECPETTECL